MTRDSSPHGKCRSCNADVLWVIAPRKGGGEGPLPVDPEPTADGNLYVYAPAGDTTKLRARYIKPGEPWPQGAKRRVSHFRTCPDASQHSRGRK